MTKAKVDELREAVDQPEQIVTLAFQIAIDIDKDRLGRIIETTNNEECILMDCIDHYDSILVSLVTFKII